MSENAKNVLLTGATGFLGSHLLRRFLENNHNVIALKRSSSNAWRIQKWMRHPNLNLYDVDRVDPRVMFEESPVDVIVHVATEYGHGGVPISTILESNLIFPIRLLELGIEYEVACFVNTDSFSNKEDNSHAKLMSYSLSKKSFLIWLKHLSKQIRVINVVLEHIYGPYDSNSKFVESLIQQIAVERAPRIALTEGLQRRDFVYVEDVVDAYMCLLDYGIHHEFLFDEFEVGSGTSVQIRDLAEAIKKVADSQTVLGFGDIPYRSNETMDSKAEISPLIKLGWSPKIGVEKGVADILNAYGV